MMLTIESLSLVARVVELVGVVERSDLSAGGVGDGPVCASRGVVMVDNV